MLVDYILLCLVLGILMVVLLTAVRLHFNPEFNNPNTNRTPYIPL